MAILTTEAVVLSRHDFSNTSLIVTFYTLDYGRLSAVAKGARRAKSPFLGTLDLLNHNEITYYRHTRTSLHTLAKSTVRDHFPGIRESEKKMVAGTYFAELTREMTREEERQPELFDHVVGALRELSSASTDPLEIDRIICHFEIRLLLFSGYAPELTSCVGCSEPVTGAKVLFSNRAGGLLCQKCAKASAADVRPTTGGAVATLRALLQRPIRRGRNISLSAKASREIKHTLRPYIVYRLEKEPRSMRYLD